MWIPSPLFTVWTFATLAISIAYLTASCVVLGTSGPHIEAPDAEVVASYSEGLIAAVLAVVVLFLPVSASHHVRAIQVSGGAAWWITPAWDGILYTSAEGAAGSSNLFRVGLERGLLLVCGP